MEQIRKVFFNPLATTKARVEKILQDLPVGSAHTFSPEKILLCRTNDGIAEIDISTYPEEFFYNAIDLGELGETLQKRMSGFPQYLCKLLLLPWIILTLDNMLITVSGV